MCENIPMLFLASGQLSVLLVCAHSFPKYVLVAFYSVEAEVPLVNMDKFILIENQ